MSTPKNISTLQKKELYHRDLVISEAALIFIFYFDVSRMKLSRHAVTASVVKRRTRSSTKVNARRALETVG